MYSSITPTLLALAAAATTVFALQPDEILKDILSSRTVTQGFQNPIVSSSANGSAICIQGNVPVYAQTTANANLKLSNPDNQTVVTEAIVEMLMAGSTLAQTVNLGAATVSGTYNINAQLCYPRSTGINANTVQILTHGVGFDKVCLDPIEFVLSPDPSADCN
jgi:hypothetical protein